MCFTNVWSFVEITVTDIKLQSGHDFVTTYLTRGIIWKIHMQELWFLCMTRRHNVLYKCMKFHWNICNGYQVIERTRFCDYLCYRGIIWKIHIQELWFLCMTRRLIVLYICMKFRWNICNGYQVIERIRFCDGQTDRQTQGENNMSPDPCRGET